MIRRRFSAFKDLAPPALRRLWREWRNRKLFSGDYGSWTHARNASSGYEAVAIRERVIEASRAVRDGEARWERDTVLFHSAEERTELMTLLRSVADSNASRLALLDFGGALGSLWWQHRHCWKDFASVQWAVVEQTEWVEVGRKEFAREGMSFHASIEDAVAAISPQVGLLSGVLAYLERPYDLLRHLAEQPIEWLVLDRVGLCCADRDRLTVQKVPPSIYDASYPCWFLSRTRLLAAVADRWELISEWDSCFDERGSWYEFKGFAFRRIQDGTRG